jgi:hypothetical protein
VATGIHSGNISFRLRDAIAPESELPSDRRPDRTKRAVVLGAVKECMVTRRWNGF